MSKSRCVVLLKLVLFFFCSLFFGWFLFFSLESAIYLYLSTYILRLYVSLFINSFVYLNFAAFCWNYEKHMNTKLRKLCAYFSRQIVVRARYLSFSPCFRSLSLSFTFSARSWLFDWCKCRIAI